MSTFAESTEDSLASNVNTDVGRLMLMIGLGCLLRFVGLGWESLWFDEACSLDMVAAPFADIVSGKKLTPGNPFGYFALLRLWCLTFGFTIESARAFSALAGTFVIPATWLTALRLTESRKVALWAGLLTAINPPLVFLGREARVYSLLALITVLATLAAIAVVRKRGIGAWIGLTLYCAILPHLHYFSFFFLPVIGVVILWSLREEFWDSVGKLLVVYLLIGLAFLPGLNLFRSQLEMVQSVAVNSLSHVLYFPAYVLGGRTFVWKQDGVLYLMIAELLAISAVWLPVFSQFWKNKQAPWIAAATACGVFIVAAGTSAIYMSMFNSRYISFILPLLMIVVSYGMVRLLESGQRFCTFPAVVLSAFFIVSLFRMYTEVHKDDWRGLSQYVAAFGPELPVVFYENTGELPFAYYRPTQPRTLLLETFADGGASWDRAGYRETLRRFDEFWLVISPIWTEDFPEQVREWCEKHFELTDRQSFRGLYLLRLRNLGAPAEAKSVGGGIELRSSFPQYPIKR